MHKPNTTLLNGPGIPVLVGHVRYYQLRNACHKGIHRRPGPAMVHNGGASWHERTERNPINWPDV
jgi:hypothetical protein